MLGYIKPEIADINYRVDLDIREMIKPYVPVGASDELLVAITNTMWNITQERGLKDVHVNQAGYPIYMADLDHVVEEFSNMMKEIG